VSIAIGDVDRLGMAAGAKLVGLLLERAMQPWRSMPRQCNAQGAEMHITRHQFKIATRISSSHKL
jgi:hypothetical protein